MGILQDIGRGVEHFGGQVGHEVSQGAEGVANAAKRNRGAIGTVIQDAAPLAGLIPGVGVPLALALSAGGGALGKAIQPGSNFGDIAKAGAISGAEGGGGAALRGALSGAAAGNAVGGATGTAPSLAEGASSVSPELSGAELAATTSAAPTAASPGILSKIASGAETVGGKALDYAGNHDRTTAAALTTAGNALDPVQRRLAQARADLLQTQAQENTYNYNRQRAQNLALAPLQQALYGKLGNSPTTAAGYTNLATGG